MDIARLDYWAATGGSVLHRASVPSKALATAAVIASVVTSDSPALLAALYLMVIVTVRAAGLPPLKVMVISFLPGLFALLYAISKAGAGLAVPAVILLKAFTAATAMILLISTTPFADIMGFIGKAMPKVLRDGLFMTYRSFFILLRLMDNLVTAIRLRGGLRPGRLVRNSRNIGSGVGILFIHAFDTSQRLYDVMSIRGYAGHLSATHSYAAFSVCDIPYLLAASIFLGAAVFGGEAGIGNPVAVIATVVIYAAIMEALRAWKR
ncbi:MAG: hypothetical protein HZA22_01155 [Nitrospirae bacterium]|nr:hypothetical protein [Nitrospirota bacterium]MBI5694749.1 hypothetical protein [Nitrospirota bacterium]